LRTWNVTDMATVGVRFGKGLQLTNILKDVARDLQRGRCYIPDTLLREARLTPSDLLNPATHNQLQPILRQLIGVARDHLDQGWMYTLAIPRRELRLRLACMWPILFAGQTLRRVADSVELLDPSVNVKMPKGQVYRIMALTTLTGGCGYVGSAYWGRVRKRIS
jgi:farnesyl-diphosphate farnesyltransferase